MLGKLQQLRTHMGTLNAFLYVMHRLLSTMSGKHAGIERFIFVAQPVPDQPHIPPGKTTTAVVKTLLPGDALLAQCMRPAEVIAARFAQGAKCLALIKEDQLQAAIWLIHGHYDEDVVRARFVLPRSGAAAWDFDVYVAPKYRLGFTFLRLWDAANAYLREAGVMWSYSRITAFNLGSLASHSRLGASPFGSATFLTLGPIQIMISTLRPWLHISFGKTQPQLIMPERKA